MQHQPMEQQALGSWETDGGRTRQLAESELGNSEKVRCLPTLPSGYLAQPLWGFSDDKGRIFEFHRVYHDAALVRDRVFAIGERLDRDLSYWLMTWTATGDTGDEFPVSQWLTYAEARKLLGPHLGFTQFSSQLQRWLPALLHMQNRLDHE